MLCLVFATQVVALTTVEMESVFVIVVVAAIIVEDS